MSPRDSRHALVAVATNVLLWHCNIRRKVTGIIRTEYDSTDDFETFQCEPRIADGRERVVVYADKQLPLTAETAASLQLRSVCLVKGNGDFSFAHKGQPLTGLHDLLASSQKRPVEASVELYDNEGRPLPHHDHADARCFGVLKVKWEEDSLVFRLPTALMAKAILRNCEPTATDIEPILVSRWDGCLPHPTVLAQNYTYRMPSFRAELPFLLEAAR